MVPGFRLLPVQGAVGSKHIGTADALKRMARQGGKCRIYKREVQILQLLYHRVAGFAPCCGVGLGKKPGRRVELRLASHC